MDRPAGKKIRVGMPAESAPPAPVAHVPRWTVAGMVTAGEKQDAGAAISEVLDRYRRAVGHTRIRISGAHCSDGPGLIQVNLRVNGAPARIQTSGRTMSDTISHATSRLDRQLHRLTTAWEPWPWPDPRRRPLAIPGLAPITRLKSFHLHLGAACQAAAYMSAMDYDVFLYTDAETGEDAVVYRCGPTGFSLARQKTMRPPSMPTLLPLTVNARKVPTLTPAQAAARLAEHWLPWLFYTDHRNRRGSLLYRRYDGDLGLITATESATGP
jgi:sigma 54 modulation/S30EA-like ribosomal protein